MPILPQQIKAEACRLGFCGIGFARAEPVDVAAAAAFRKYIAAGGHARMDYMAGHEDLRLDPTKLCPGARTVISLAAAYGARVSRPATASAGIAQYGARVSRPAAAAEHITFAAGRGSGDPRSILIASRGSGDPRSIPSGSPIASYALGDDYHEVLRARMRALADAAGLRDYRAFVDTAPVLERYWAAKSGVGWIGRNHQLIVPDIGPEVFLCEIITAEELPPTPPIAFADDCDGGPDGDRGYDSDSFSGCGDCHACIDACPMGALRGDVFLSERCMSYHTIERRGPLTPAACAAIRATGCFYGCDRCAAACPHSLPHATIDEFRPRPAILAATADDWRGLSRERYQELFRHSAVKRAKYEGLMRNIEQWPGA